VWVGLMSSLVRWNGEHGMERDRARGCLGMRGEQFSTQCFCDSALSTPINLCFYDPIESEEMPYTTLSRL
jgi:hypothetical protein